MIGSSDIASFYKEQLAGETGTYVQDRAVATGASTQEVLQVIAGEVVVAVRDAENRLQGAREKSAWTSFVTGYIRFHTSCRRYRLNELQLCSP